jgi:hypothetical protein
VDEVALVEPVAAALLPVAVVLEPEPVEPVAAELEDEVPVVALDPPPEPPLVADELGALGVSEPDEHAAKSAMPAVSAETSVLFRKLRYRIFTPSVVQPRPASRSAWVAHERNTEIKRLRAPP